MIFYRGARTSFENRTWVFWWGVTTELRFHYSGCWSLLFSSKLNMFFWFKVKISAGKKEFWSFELNLLLNISIVPQTYKCTAYIFVEIKYSLNNRCLTCQHLFQALKGTQCHRAFYRNGSPDRSAVCPNLSISCCLLLPIKGHGQAKSGVCSQSNQTDTVMSGKQQMLLKLRLSTTLRTGRLRSSANRIEIGFMHDYYEHEPNTICNPSAGILHVNKDKKTGHKIILKEEPLTADIRSGRRRTPCTVWEPDGTRPALPPARPAASGRSGCAVRTQGVRRSDGARGGDSRGVTSLWKWSSRFFMRRKAETNWGAWGRCVDTGALK